MDLMKVRIETEKGFIHKITDVDGNNLLSKFCFDATLRMKAGDVARLEMHHYLTEATFQGEVKIENIVICPSCRQEVEKQLAEGAKELEAVDTSALGDEWRTCVVGPKQ